jgi:hypothetical protein
MTFKVVIGPKRGISFSKDMERFLGCGPYDEENGRRRSPAALDRDVKMRRGIMYNVDRVSSVPSMEPRHEKLNPNSATTI